MKKIDYREKLGKIGLGYSYFYPYDNKEQIREEIHRALDPLYKEFDVIYAIDGRYANYEADRDYSIDYAYKVLDEYPNVVREECKPMFQTLKRQRYFDLAGKDNCNWLMVWDSDDIIYPSPECQRWDKFWANLYRYSKKFPEYRLFKMKSWLPPASQWRRAYNAVETGWHPYIRLHKDPGTMRYALWCHWWWCPKDATDEDLILQKKGLFVSDHTIDGVRFTTNSHLRGEVQLEARDGWAWNNIQEEHRRCYITQNRINFNAPKSPDWIQKEFDGFYRYDKQGKPISKIANEDGTLVH